MLAADPEHSVFTNVFVKYKVLHQTVVPDVTEHDSANFLSRCLKVNPLKVTASAASLMTEIMQRNAAAPVSSMPSSRLRGPLHVGYGRSCAGFRFELMVDPRASQTAFGRPKACLSCFGCTSGQVMDSSIEPLPGGC